MTITVGIPTCYGGQSLVETIKSIRNSKNVSNLRLVIVADRTPIEESIRRQLKELGVELYWRDLAGSQFAKLQQLVQLLNSDIFIFTQDDITFEPNTISEIVKTFKKSKKITMVTTRVLPLKPVTLMESIMSVEPRIHDRIARLWNNSSNYFASSGRCFAFRSEFIRKFRIPKSVVNGDTFLYFENKRLKGVHLHQVKAQVYIRSPQRLKDQIGPSSRYQLSRAEMARYFTFDLAREYQIPINVLMRAVISEFIMYPVQTLAFAIVHFYTRIKRQSVSITSNPVWNVDISTKKI